jgi:hypothetical protein
VNPLVPLQVVIPAEGLIALITLEWSVLLMLLLAMPWIHHGML